MKKLLFIGLLFLSFTANAQEIFVRNYNYCIYTENGVKQAEKEVSLVVVFNADGEKKIVFKFDDGSGFTMYQVSKIENGKTESGYEYQGLNVINKKSGEEFYLQLFDKDDALRLIFGEDNTIEFYK
jgi:hypothetical protein